MDRAHVTHTPLVHVPADNNAGWGIAAAVVALAVACVIGAFVIHKRTFRDPADPTYISSLAVAEMAVSA